jgi:multiple sugar transport system substrate-binding protein
MHPAFDLTRRHLLGGAGLAAAALATGGLAGCGSSGSSGSGGSGGGGASPTSTPTVNATVPSSMVEKAKALKSKSASILSSKEYTTEANDVIDAAMAAFGKQTGTDITNSVINQDAGNFVAKQDAAVKAGNVQDMAFIQAGRFIAQLKDLGDIVDVSDVAQTLIDKYGEPADVSRHYMYIDGKWWGIPFYTSAGGIFVRTDWLDDAGVKPDDIKTYDQLRDTALEISDPSKKRYGWGMTVNRGGDANGLIEGVVNAWGGSIMSDDGRKVMFDSDQTIEGVTWLADIFTSDKYKNMLPPGILSWTDTGNNEAYLAGVIGITSNQASVYAEAKATNNPVYGKTRMLTGVTGPAIKRPLNFLSIYTFVVFKNAKNPDLAKLLAQYMISSSAFLPLAKAGGAGIVLPAYNKVWKADPYYLKGDPIFKPAYEVANRKINIPTDTGFHFPQAPSAGHDAVLQAYVMTDMMAGIIQKGQTPKEAVKAAHKRMVSIFEQNGIKQ